MLKYKARPAETQNQSEVAIDVFEEGKDVPLTTVRQAIPQGFPAELKRHLAEFMAIGFNAQGEEVFGTEILGLEELAISNNRGRPLDPAAEEEAQNAQKFRAEHPTWRWLEIARQVCRFRQTPRHRRCDKKCADRLEKAVKALQARQEVKSLLSSE